MVVSGLPQRDKNSINTQQVRPYRLRNVIPGVAGFVPCVSCLCKRQVCLFFLPLYGVDCSAIKGEGESAKNLAGRQITDGAGLLPCAEGRVEHCIQLAMKILFDP